MADSLQKWVGRNRPPRVQITYDVEVGGAVEKKELPLVVGLLADLSGQQLVAPPKLKARRLVDIDRDNFNEVMQKIAPRLDLSVPDTLPGKDGSLKIELNFKTFDDFHPEAIVKQVPRLAKLLEVRQQQRMLGILSGWHFPDGDGQLVSHQHTPPAQPLLTFSLALQENDNAMLERVGIVNQALKQYREQTKHDSRMSETALRSIAELALQRIAHSPVITTVDERVLFAFHALRYHAHIDLSPEFQYLLSTETQPADIRYRQRICALTPKDWQRLADECQHLTVATHKNKELLP